MKRVASGTQILRFQFYAFDVPLILSLCGYCISVVLPWWIVEQPTGADYYSFSFGIYSLIASLQEIIADPELQYLATILILGPPHCLFWVAIVWRVFDCDGRRTPKAVVVALGSMSILYAIFLLSMFSVLQDDRWTYGSGLLVAAASGVVAVLACTARYFHFSSLRKQQRL